LKVPMSPSAFALAVACIGLAGLIVIALLGGFT
jgi:hypothetical protein